MAPHHTRPSLYARPADILSEHPRLALSLAALAVLVIAVHILRLARVLVQTFLVPGISLKKFGAKSGAWAVVTGATDGIGKEFALQLAKAGFNVLLAARSPEKLGAVAGEIESKYGVKTKTVAIDFSKPELSNYAGLDASLSGLDIGVLINNVGKSYSMPTSFCDHALSEDLSIVQINVASLLHVTHAVLPRMLAQHRGLVLNIGSFSGAFPSPLLSVYSGAKAFVQAWSQCLSAEVAGTGVHVELVNAYFVVSNLSKIRRPSLVAPTPKAYVASVLRKLGVPCGSIGRPYSITPYWTHALGDWAVQHYAPKAWLLRYVTDMHKDIRRRALKKQERLAKKN